MSCQNQIRPEEDDAYAIVNLVKELSKESFKQFIRNTTTPVLILAYDDYYHEFTEKEKDIRNHFERAALVLRGFVKCGKIRRREMPQEKIDITETSILLYVSEDAENYSLKIVTGNVKKITDSVMKKIKDIVKMRMSMDEE